MWADLGGMICHIKSCKNYDKSIIFKIKILFYNLSTVIKNILLVFAET